MRRSPRLPYGWALDGVARGECSDLRFLLSRCLEELSESSGTSLDGSDPGDCLSGIFSPAGVGTDFGSRAFVFHAGWSRPAAANRRYSQDWRLGRSFSNLRWGWRRRLCLCLRAIGRLWRAPVAAACIELAAAWMYYGTEVMRTYFHSLMHLREVLPLLEPRLYQTHSLRSFWSLLLPWPRVVLALYTCSPHWASWSWQFNPGGGRRRWQLAFSALLLATVLVSPHLTVYDLVILAPAFLLLGNWALAHRERQFALRYSTAHLCLLSAVPDGTVSADDSPAAFSSGNDSTVVDKAGGFVINDNLSSCHPERNLFIRLRMERCSRKNRYDLRNTVACVRLRCRLENPSNLAFWGEVRDPSTARLLRVAKQSLRSGYR